MEKYKVNDPNLTETENKLLNGEENRGTTRTDIGHVEPPAEKETDDEMGAIVDNGDGEK